MRRCSVLLSVALAVGAALSTSPASASPICATAWTGGEWLPPVEVSVTCIDYPYGTYCQDTHTWHHPQAHLYTDACYPRLF